MSAPCRPTGSYRSAEREGTQVNAAEPFEGTVPAVCPRCGASFGCGANAPGPCACAGPPLSAALRADLSARYIGCLCVPCLRQLQAAEAAACSLPVPPA